MTSVMSTEAPASCNGRATTCPASLMSKYLAPQRWMLYRVRAAWMSQDSLASLGLLIKLFETEAHYRRMRREFNRLNENFLNATGISAVASGGKSPQWPFPFHS